MYHKSCHHFPWHIPMYNSCNYNYRSYDPQYYNWYNNDSNLYEKIILRDYGQSPFVVNMDLAAKQNKNYRTAIWTGKNLQVTLMSINVGDDIGLEAHPTTDQFIRIEEGQGLVQMGDRKDQLDFQVMAYDGYAIMIPAGKWHNVINTGNMPLKIYVIYAPPEHPFGTVHESKEIAMSAER
ncbi:cupin domain-containing protein [Paenibacillus sp. FSL W8-0439]|uniref:cupin domain-containing protein n=1 Tax=Paenibacillus sp. FSL W8-0439 TaxID=2921716 RepID=UPI0030FC8125